MLLIYYDNIIKNALEQYAPKLLEECVPLGIGDHHRTDLFMGQVEDRTDLFSKIEIKIIKHERTVPIELWIEELTTHSPIYQHDKKISYSLLHNLKNNISSQIGNGLKISHDTHCLLAWKY